MAIVYLTHAESVLLMDGQADIDALVDVLAIQMDDFRESGNGSTTGALMLLDALSGSRDFLKIAPNLLEYSDYIRTRLGETR